jgi:putative ABC transport system ATP-binding protein
MIEAINISKAFNNEAVVSDFNIKIKKGNLIAITGESGTGKTTILNMLGLLEKPDFGEVIVEGVTNLKRKQTMMIQRHKFGYLFQNYALIENDTVAENLKIALEYRKGVDKKSVMKEALYFVNLNSSFLEKKIYQLSGGEQQRVAIARLYLKESDYIFADEPTGNLDTKNRDIVFSLLKQLNEMGKAVVYVTHDLDLAERADQWIKL